ncbi:MAG: polymerase subunit beta [Bacteroidota bacterium]
MNFIVSSTTLLRHLQSISGCVNSSNSMPILDNFLFDIIDSELTVSASDLETTMITNLGVQAEENGKVAIPAKMILEVLKNLPDQPCTFRIKDDHMVEITYDNGRSEMQGFNGDEFPKLPRVENKNSIKISGNIIQRAISKTLFATGNDDLRPVMSGVYCMFAPGEITFVATDAHKLVRYTRTDVETSSSGSFILPKKPLNLLKNNLSGEEEVMLEYNESNAIFTFGDIVLVCRLVDGKYPNYDAVIPRENPNVLTVNRDQFAKAIRRVSIFSNKTTHQVRLKLAGSELGIFAEDLEFQNAASERLTSSYDGDDMEIGFNSRFLMEMLNNLESEEIVLSMSMPNRAGLLTPATYSVENENILMLVMPVMVNR